MRKRLKFKVAAVSALLLSIVLVSFFSANKLVYADENITIPPRCISIIRRAAVR